MHPPSFKEYHSSPEELSYDIQSQSGDLRFAQEAHGPTSSLTLVDGPQQSPLLPLFSSNGLHGPYTHDTGGFYQAHGSIQYAADVRPRLASNSSPSTGMAHAASHAHRNSNHHNLSHIGAREQYATTTPSFRRASEYHLSRSPPFAGAASRRHQLTAPQTNFLPSRMEAGQYGGRQTQSQQGGGAPPLQPVQTLGSLQYMDPAMTPIKVEITGKMEKGPFLSRDQEWTCYRRNYLACVCSYSLSPNWPNVGMQFTPTPPSSSSATAASTAQSPPQHAIQVLGFAMCISAVVAENEQQNIELVQHTPKRDKGPISKPPKVPLMPKTGQSSSTHHAMGGYGDSSTRPYPDGMGGSHGQQTNGNGNSMHPQMASEHMFERIQFKHATLNNGKRRAAQQYYHLIVELWADVGSQMPEQYIKVAYRKSAKMIVRGRSPGHYQNERRGSQGEGPGGSAGSMGGGYSAIGSMPDFNSSQMLAGTTNGAYSTAAYSANSTANDSRVASNNVYVASRPPTDLTAADDAADDSAKMALDGTTKGYQHYYPGPVFEGQHDRVDVFHPRGEGILPSIASEAKVKSEYEFGNMLPRPHCITASTPRVLEGHQFHHQHQNPHQVQHQHQHQLLNHHPLHHTDHHQPRQTPHQRPSDQFENTKATTTSGYYPSIMSPTGIHLTIA